MASQFVSCSAKLCSSTVLCTEDSGGGLVFATEEGPFQRYYLRGVASAAPNNDKELSPLVDGFSTLKDCQLSTITQQQCVLPKYPENGSYFVIDDKPAKPGDVFDNVSLIEYTRDEYFVLEIVYLDCVRGAWSRQVLKRIPRLDAWKQSGDVDINPHTDTNPGYCELPPYPQHGFYVVAGDASTEPGHKRISILLEYACDEGYSLMGNGYVRCENGTWLDDAPQCMDVTEIIINRQKPEMPLPAQNESSTCRLPPYPDQGRYEVSLQSQVGSSENYIYLQLIYRCHDGYAIDGSVSVECLNGEWFQKPPTCIGSCQLVDSPGLFYLCKTQNSDIVPQFCSANQPNGVEMIPLCKTPYYSSSKPLLPMKCVDGRWNYEPVCSAECGVKVSERRYRQLPSSISPAAGGGRPAKTNEFPWHAGIYTKVNQTHIQKCSGSIISPKLIVTAAHCFWKDQKGLLSSSQFAVAAGKLYQEWNDIRDYFTNQTSDVDRIVTPETFQGGQTNFQDDIALMYLTKPFVFNDFVRPVCVDFEFDFENTHLTHGNLGTVAGWGLIDEEGSTTPILQVVNLPYVKFEQCYNDAPLGFRVYITSDKICAGYTNGNYMPRTNLPPKPPRKRQKWCKEQMRKAVEAVRNKSMAFKKAVKFFSVPRATLRRLVHDSDLSSELVVQNSLGKKSVLSFDLEQKLVEYLLFMEQKYYGLTRMNVRRMAFRLATKNNIPNIFRNNIAGRAWLDHFLRRHKDKLSLRKALGISQGRVQDFNRSAVNEFFDILEIEYVKTQFPPDRIHNVDETALTVVQPKIPVIGRKGKRQIGALTAVERGSLMTIVCAMSAGGTFIPPMMIFPRKKFSDVLMKGLVLLAKSIRRAESPILLILDGHYSHTRNLEILEVARERHVVIVSLPPYTTHRLQPLDRTFMGALKTYYSHEIRTFLLHSNRILKPHDMAELFRKAYLRSITGEMAVNGFKKFQEAKRGRGRGRGRRRGRGRGRGRVNEKPAEGGGSGSENDENDFVNTDDDSNSRHSVQGMLPDNDDAICIFCEAHFSTDERGTALCKGDSGGGLVFATEEGQFQRYYLRGVASAAPSNDKECNTHAVTTFTRILKHERFIRYHLNSTNM
ncbi:Modular serine protease [Eumeta japonica]|uniref:Modular serine protease n=1 Tax=Eumeta variegata TaxID=151549 RepID=A0A4C1TWQ8_EUMVA|nr:Modular serine protease [Eumeta japonica]